MASTELFLLPCFLLFFSPLPASGVSCEMKTIRHIDLKGAQLTFPSLCIFGGARAGLARLRPGPGVDLTAGILLVKKIKLWWQLSVYLLGDKFSLSWEGIEYTVLLPLFLPMCPLGVTREWEEELSTDTIPWNLVLWYSPPWASHGPGMHWCMASGSPSARLLSRSAHLSRLHLIYFR